MFVVHLWVGICVFVGREGGVCEGGGSFKFVVVCVCVILCLLGVCIVYL